MNSEDIKTDIAGRMTDDDDQQFWEEFNREMWLLFKKAESLPDFEIDEPDFASFSDSLDFYIADNLREDCLTYERCSELGQMGFEISDIEKSHIKACRFCERRIENFQKLVELVVTSQINTSEFPKNAERNVLLLSFKEKFRSFLWSPTPVAAVMVIMILIFSAIGVSVVFYYKQPEQTAKISDSRNPPSEIPSIFPTNTQTEENGAIVQRNTNLKNSEITTNPTENLPSLKPKKAKNIIQPDKPFEADFSDELAFLSNAEREAVKQSIQIGRIQISKDLAELTDVPVRRSNQNSQIELLSPKNEATIESRPLLSWEYKNKVRFQVLIFDKNFSKVAESEILTQNSWQINKPLAAGFYFWQVLAENEISGEFVETGNTAYFKVIGGSEKNILEAAKKQVRSHIVKAIIFARAGLLNEAAQELNLELRNQNPESPKARKMLNQVLEWKMR